jgi:histidine phosphotransfer protein HptB
MSSLRFNAYLDGLNPAVISSAAFGKPEHNVDLRIDRTISLGHLPLKSFLPKGSLMMPLMTEAAGLYSTLADDPDIGELVELFIDELPERIAALQAAFAAGDVEALRRCAHQLKGAAGSYGFDAMTPALQSLEQRAGQDRPLIELQPLLDEVTSFAGRVRAGLPQ